MDISPLVPLIFKASILLTVFALGLQASLADLVYVARHPGEFLRSLLAMMVLGPALAALLAAAFGLHPAIAITLIALSVGPVPPVLPKKQIKAGGEASYAFGLLVAVALVSIVTTPAAIAVMGWLFKVPVSIAPAKVATIVFTSVVVPLLVGMLVRHLVPRLAERCSKPLVIAATTLFFLSLVPLVALAWHETVSLVSFGSLVAIALFNVIALAMGHLLGGPEKGHRVVLALSTALRHPGVAFAIATANFPDVKLVLGALTIYFAVNAVASVLYLMWRRRQAAAAIKADERIG